MIIIFDYLINHMIKIIVLIIWFDKYLWFMLVHHMNRQKSNTVYYYFYFWFTGSVDNKKIPYSSNSERVWEITFEPYRNNEIRI